MKPLEIANRDVSLVSRNETGSRWDYHFHNRKYLRVIALIDAIRNFTSDECAFAVPLASFASLVTDRFIPSAHPDDTFQYIEIGGINLHTGEIVPTETFVRDAPSRAQVVVKTDDIVVSTVRPRRNAVGMVTPDLDGAVASSGLAVLRVSDSSVSCFSESSQDSIHEVKITPHYLFSYLKSDLTRLQLERLTTASMYPTFSKTDILQILVLVSSGTPSESRFIERITYDSQKVFDMLSQIRVTRQSITDRFNCFLEK